MTTTTSSSLLQVLILIALLSLSESEESSRGAPRTDEECLSLGYDKNVVDCFRCHDLSRFQLDELKESCLSCCTERETRPVIKKYPSARLEICACNLGHYPQVQAFVKSDRPKAFPNLAIKHVPGRHPTIVLKDSQGNEVEEMSIRKWDTDTIEEFLREHLL